MRSFGRSEGRRKTSLPKSTTMYKNASHSLQRRAYGPDDRDRAKKKREFKKYKYVEKSSECGRKEKLGMWRRKGEWKIEEEKGYED